MKKNQKELKKNISEILVVNDKDLSPYIEILNFSPENITQKSLGTLLGCFEIKDDSDDSAYIVNFLSSVVKKEYFLNPKRPASKSFEAALHKVNVALSEIAKHNNISWIGKFDATLCVIEKYSIHFSVTGGAKILLFRDGNILEISEGLSSDEEISNPIKTFTDISSGKLRHGDKVIITSEDLFHVLSLDDLKRTASKFSNEKFARFVNTALVNELAIAGTIIVDIEENAIVSPITTRAKTPLHTQPPQMIENAFSGQVFEKKTQLQGSQHITQKPPKKEIITAQPKINEVQNKEEQQKTEYTDKKTGHIYLKDDEFTPQKESTPFSNTLTELQEKFTDFKHWFIKNAKGKWSSQIKKALHPKNIRELKNKAIEKSREIRSRDELEFRTETEDSPPLQTESPTSKTTEKPNYKNLSQSSLEVNQGLKGTLPNISKLKEAFLSLTKQQKIFALTLLVIIVFTPIIFSKVNSRKIAREKASESIGAIQPKPPEEIYSQEKNIVFLKKSENIYSDKDIIGVKVTNDNIFAIKKNSILIFANDKLVNEFPFPQDFTEARLFTFMESLDMFFIFTDTNQILGFNSVSKNFQHYVLDLPEGAEIRDIGAFLTNIYLADANANQIYRYPKGIGVFGEKTDWLKETVDLGDITDFDVDERITIITENNPPESFFKKQKYSLIFENSKTSISYDRIHTVSLKDETNENESIKYFYVLDTKNSRIVKFNNQGQLLQQYHNEKIESASDFTVTENNTIYLSTTNGLQKLSLE